jgi:hypothetical protein
MLRRLALPAAVLALAMPAVHGQSRRPLAIEDYYRVLTITNPQISEDGKTVRYSVTTRVESDNSTKTDIFTVPTDGSASPTKVGEGGGRGGAATGSAPAGRGGGGGAARITSPDGKWIARTQETARPKKDASYASDFEKRHAERFKGVTFDWKVSSATAATSPRRIPRHNRRCRSCSRPPQATTRRPGRSSTRTCVRRISPGIPAGG